MKDKQEINWKNLLKNAVRMKKILLSIIILGTLIATVIAFILPKTYESTALMRLKTSGATSVPTVMDMDKLATEQENNTVLNLNFTQKENATPENYIAIMQSKSVLEPIMEQVDLPQEEKEQMTVEDFAKKYLEFKNAKNTDLISVTAYGKTPEEAQMIAQSVINNFTSVMDELNKKDQNVSLDFLAERIDLSKQEMENAENNFAAYRQEKKIYALDEQGALLLEQIMMYDSAVTEMQVQSETNRVKLQNVSNQLQQQNTSLTTYNTGNLEIFANLRQEIVDKQLELISLKQRYTDEHPDVKRCRDELNELESSLKNEVRQTVNSQSLPLTPLQGALLGDKIESEVAIGMADASLSAIKEKAADVETQISKLSADSVEYIRLARKQNIAQQTYIDLMKAQEALKVQQIQSLASIQVIDDANLPHEDMPAKPNKALIIFIGFAVSVAIAFGYLVYKEKY